MNSKTNRVKVREYTKKSRGKQYDYFRVDFPKENGKWTSRTFKSKEVAQSFAQHKEVEVANHSQVRSVLTRLTQEQIREAENAIYRLGEHSLSDVVAYFEKHYRPDIIAYTMEDATEYFLARKKKDGVRERSLYQLERTLEAFKALMGNAKEVATITTEECERFLKAKSCRNKTWNNYRADLHNFFNLCIDKKWCAKNPVSEIKKQKVVRGRPDLLNAERARELMAYVESYKGGRMVPYFALCLFGGIRPHGEMHKLAKSKCIKRIIDMENQVVHIDTEISKTGQYRQVMIREPLAAFLKAYSGPILPKGYDRDIKHIRKHFGLTHDVLRHTFISMHVAKHKSVGEACLEAGNSEHITRTHYLNLATYKEGDQFWSIKPKGSRNSEKAA